MNDKEKTRQQLIDELQMMREREKSIEERLKRKNLESLGILAGGIAHDFNNLLSTLMGNISMARMLLHEGAKLNRVLERALETSVTGMDLTQKLLTFSDGGNPSIEKKSLWPIVEDALDDDTRASNVTFKKHLPDNLPQILCDKTQMIQVIRNLVTNAVQAMPQGGLLEINAQTIMLKPENDMDLSPGIYIKLSIKDQGAGISQEALDKIFLPYFSTRNDLTQNGLGLGLPICRSIMIKHNGHIVAEPVKEGGTAFHVYIPAAD